MTNQHQTPVATESQAFVRLQSQYAKHTLFDQNLTPAQILLNIQFSTPQTNQP